MRLSASQLASFDPRTTWGCNRRWWFRNIAGRSEPQNRGQEQGEQVHAEIEHYLKTGVNGMGPIAMSGFEYMPPPMEPGMGVEHVIQDGELDALGVPFAGKIDVWRPGIPEIIDWKTSSNVMLYKKQPPALLKDIQVNSYAMWAFRRDPSLEAVKARLVYLQTGRTRYSDESAVVLTRGGVEGFWAGEVTPLVRNILDTAKAERIEDIPPTEAHCTVGRTQCPHFNVCPRKGVVSMAGLLDFLNFDEAPAAAPAPAAQGELPLVPPPAVKLPEPDVQVAVSPEVVDAVVAAVEAPPPEPKRGPGRPPGSRNKPKLADLVPSPASNPAAQPSVTVTRVALRHSLTVNLGNYQSAKVEVELDASVSDMDATLAVEELGKQVKAALNAEVRPYLEQQAKVGGK